MTETPASAGLRGDAPKLLVISLHDVAPPFHADIAAQVSTLAEMMVRRLVFKVVPNWHGAHPLSEERALKDLLLRQLEGQAQIVLHGYQHRVRGPWRGSPLRQTRARVFATRAAEFMTLSGPEAANAVATGRDELERSGLGRPDTFCAPGWLMTDEAEDALAESGMRFITGMFSFLDLSRRTLTWTPATGYMGGSTLHELGISALNRVASATGSGARVRKVYLHPDPSGRRRWMRAIGSIQAYLESGYQPATFHDVAAAVWASP